MKKLLTPSTDIGEKETGNPTKLELQDVLNSKLPNDIKDLTDQYCTTLSQEDANIFLKIINDNRVELNKYEFRNGENILLINYLNYILEKNGNISFVSILWLLDKFSLTLYLKQCTLLCDISNAVYNKIGDIKSTSQREISSDGEIDHSIIDFIESLSPDQKNIFVQLVSKSFNYNKKSKYYLKNINLTVYGEILIKYIDTFKRYFIGYGHTNSI